MSGSPQPLRSSSSGRCVPLNGTADPACFQQPDQTEGCDVSISSEWGRCALQGIEGAGGSSGWSYRGRWLEGTRRNHAPSLRQYRLQLNHSWQMFTYLFFRRNREGGPRQSISVLNGENVAIKKGRNSFSFCCIRDIVCFYFLVYLLFSVFIFLTCFWTYIFPNLTLPNWTQTPHLYLPLYDSFLIPLIFPAPLVQLDPRQQGKKQNKMAKGFKTGWIMRTRLGYVLSGVLQESQRPAPRCCSLLKAPARYVVPGWFFFCYSDR